MWAGPPVGGGPQASLPEPTFFRGNPYLKFCPHTVVMSSYLFSPLKVLLGDSAGLGPILKTAVNKRTFHCSFHCEQKNRKRLLARGYHREGEGWCNKLCKLGWLKTTEIHSLTFRRLEVQNEGVSAGSFSLWRFCQLLGAQAFLGLWQHNPVSASASTPPSSRSLSVVKHSPCVSVFQLPSSAEDTGQRIRPTQIQGGLILVIPIKTLFPRRVPFTSTGG